MKAIIYARCRTDESRQDVEVQLGQLRREYEQEFEYGSGYKGDQPKLKGCIGQIKMGLYIIYYFTPNIFFNSSSNLGLILHPSAFACSISLRLLSYSFLI